MSINPPLPPVGPASVCPDCERSGVGVCDAYPDCPAGRADQESDEYCAYGCMPMDHGEDDEPTIIIGIDPSDKGVTGVYTYMVHRNADGSDPLVPEPGP